MVKNDRINLRIEESIKDIWKEVSEKLGYDDLSKFIIEKINDAVEQNNDLLDENDKQIILLKKRKIQADKLKFLMKENRSEAFSIGRFVKIINNFLQEKSFIDIEHLEKEIKFQIEWAKLRDDPKRYLLNFLPHLKNKELTSCYNLVEKELISLGLSKKEINKIHFPKNSINSVTRKLNYKTKHSDM